VSTACLASNCRFFILCFYPGIFVTCDLPSAKFHEENAIASLVTSCMGIITGKSTNNKLPSVSLSKCRFSCRHAHVTARLSRLTSIFLYVIIVYFLVPSFRKTAVGSLDLKQEIQIQIKKKRPSAQKLNFLCLFVCFFFGVECYCHTFI
jgi:hypothetical protein